MPWSPERRTQHRAAMERTAEKNTCPKCGRKSAIVWQPTRLGGTYCRWDDCDYHLT